MFSKKDLPFFKENLRQSYLADLQKSYETLTTNLGKILRKSCEVSKSGPQNDWHDDGQPQVTMHRKCHFSSSVCPCIIRYRSSLNRVEHILGKGLLEQRNPKFVRLAVVPCKDQLVSVSTSLRRQTIIHRHLLPLAQVPESKPKLPCENYLHT